MRDRDVMNLLDQLELYTLKAGQGKVTQKDYWLFVHQSVKSGELATKVIERHVANKLEGLGCRPNGRLRSLSKISGDVTIVEGAEWTDNDYAENR